MRSRSSFLLCGVLLVGVSLVEAGLGNDQKKDYGHENDYSDKKDDGKEYQEEKDYNRYAATHTDSYPTAQQILRANGGLIQPFQLGNQQYPALPQHYAGLPQYNSVLPQYYAGLSQYNPVLPQHYPRLPQYNPVLPQHYPR